MPNRPISNVYWLPELTNQLDSLDLAPASVRPLISAQT